MNAHQTTNIQFSFLFTMICCCLCVRLAYRKTKKRQLLTYKSYIVFPTFLNAVTLFFPEVNKPRSV